MQEAEEVLEEERHADEDYEVVMRQVHDKNVKSTLKRSITKLRLTMRLRLLHMMRLQVVYLPHMNQ